MKHYILLVFLAAGTLAASAQTLDIASWGSGWAAYDGSGSSVPMQGTVVTIPNNGSGLIIAQNADDAAFLNMGAPFLMSAPAVFASYDTINGYVLQLTDTSGTATPLVPDGTWMSGPHAPIDLTSFWAGATTPSSGSGSQSPGTGLAVLAVDFDNNLSFHPGLLIAQLIPSIVTALTMCVSLAALYIAIRLIFRVIKSTGDSADIDLAWESSVYSEATGTWELFFQDGTSLHVTNDQYGALSAINEQSYLERNDVESLLEHQDEEGGLMNPSGSYAPNGRPNLPFHESALEAEEASD
jgi:hypothetical protein